MEKGLLEKTGKLLAEINKFGSDIRITPKKDSVSIIRKKQLNHEKI